MSENSISITCPACSTVFSLSADLIGERGRILRCSICKHRFLVKPEHASASTAGPAEEESPFSTGATAAERPDETRVAGDEPFGAAGAEPEAAPEEDSAIQVGSHEELEQAGEVLESFLEVGDLGDEAADDMAAYDAIDTSEVLVGEDDEDEEEMSEFSGTGEDEGMVEFFVEDDSGQIERVETRASEEQKATAAKKPEKKDEAPPAPPRKLTGEETVEMPAMDFGEEQAEPQDTIVQQPQQPPPAAKMKKPHPAQRWRDPGKGPKRRILATEKDAKPSSGVIYLIALILIGGGGIATNFVQLGSWRFDPVWSGALILFGIIGFFLQNLSGLYVSGFFTLFYGFGLFSRQQANIESGSFGGVWHLLVLFAIGFLFLLIYYILMNRKHGHFIIQEGQGQSMAALLIGLCALLAGVFGHITSQALPRLGELVYMGTPLQEITFYTGVSLSVIIQSAIAATAVAFGFSAVRVRNRGLVLAVIGILFGLIVFGLLYAQMVMGEVRIPLPI